MHSLVLLKRTKIEPIQPPVSLALDLVYLVICWLLAITRFFVLRRQYNRNGVFGRRWRISEVFIYIALVVLTAAIIGNSYISVQVIRYRGDPGIIPNLGLPPKLATVEGKIFFWHEFNYLTIIWSTKFSFCALYWQLKHLLPKGFKFALYCVIGWISAAFLNNIFLTFFWCLPLKTNWTLGPGYCSETTALGPVISTFVTNVTCDLFLIAFAATLFKLFQLQGREIVAVGFIVFLGALTIACACVRLGLLVQDLTQLNPIEQYYFTRFVWLVGSTECMISFIAACLPALRVLLRIQSTAQAGASTRPRRRDKSEGSSGIGIWSAQTEKSEPQHVETAATMSNIGGRGATGEIEATTE